MSGECHVGCGYLCHDVYCFDDREHPCHICGCNYVPPPIPPENIGTNLSTFGFGAVLCVLGIIVLEILFVLLLASTIPSPR